MPGSKGRARLAWVEGEIGALVIAFLHAEHLTVLRVALRNYETLCGAEGDARGVEVARHLVEKLSCSG